MRFFKEKHFYGCLTVVFTTLIVGSAISLIFSIVKDAYKILPALYVTAILLAGRYLLVAVITLVFYVKRKVRETVRRNKKPLTNH